MEKLFLCVSAAVLGIGCVGSHGSLGVPDVPGDAGAETDAPTDVPGDTVTDRPADGPCACPGVYDPVCGIDGMTYGNSCMAGCAGVAVACRGACPCPTGCGDGTCSAGETCTSCPADCGICCTPGSTSMCPAGTGCGCAGPIGDCTCGPLCNAPADCVDPYRPTCCGGVCIHGCCGCVSRREYKDDIRYLSPEDVSRLGDDLLRIRLATYRYRANPDRDHLGFIIEDNEPAVFIDSKGGSVDLYILHEPGGRSAPGPVPPDRGPARRSRAPARPRRRRRPPLPLTDFTRCP